MDERELRGLIRAVRKKRLDRRSFVRLLGGFGLSAPFANLLLAHQGLTQTAAPAPYKPTKAGGGGLLKILSWQGPTLLNPHFAVGTKDQEGSRLFYEPLAGWDVDGNLVPMLAAEIPSAEEGGVAADGLSVTWKLKRGVLWHDGQPFTADDVVFNYEYAADPATAATTLATYREVTAEKLDDYTVRVHFAKPTPFWADAFVGQRGLIIPKHLYEAYKGSASRDAPANLAPVGTGPYKFVEFKPGDLVRGERFVDYHVANRPYFDGFELKGGGEAVSAARAVIQTGEYDFAQNMQVEDELLRKLEASGDARGKVVILPSGAIEHIQLNMTDPWTEVDGEFSSIKTKHPLFSDPAVARAMTLLVDRAGVEKFIYGRTGTATGNILNNPPRFVSKNTKWAFDIDKANQILDAAGWKRGSDGLRAKDGKTLKFVFHTSINGPRQKTQAIVKRACQQAGIEIEIKATVAQVYFSSDVGNPDISKKFPADMQMSTVNMLQPDPEAFMRPWLSWEVAQKDNKWQGLNTTRWQSEEYDKAYRASQAELDPVKRAALFIAMNDMVVNAPIEIPVVYRPNVNAVGNQLVTSLSGWDCVFYNLKDWYREA
jgi:peptide/nickel transport system substrate-binding protein